MSYVDMVEILLGLLRGPWEGVKLSRGVSHVIALTTPCTFQHIGEDNPFGRIPVDQTCKETVNKDTRTSGGTKGFSLRPNAVSKCYLVAEYRSTFLRQLKEMLHISSSCCQHKDLQPARIARDEADVQSIVSILQNTSLNHS